MSRDLKSVMVHYNTLEEVEKLCNFFGTIL